MTTATNPPAGPPTLVLVHGAWYGPWAWDELRRRFDQNGLASVAVALTSVNENINELGSLADDVSAISAALDELTGPFILVGHSYAGLPVTEVAASRTDVVHAVYVCAFAVPVGSTLLDAVGGEPPNWWLTSDDGSFMLPDDPGQIFFAECAPSVADDAIVRLRPHSTRAVHQPLRKAAYGQLPATYVVCERDARFPAHDQRATAELVGARTVSLETDHSPMLSRPADLAAILSGIGRVR